MMRVGDGVPAEVQVFENEIVIQSEDSCVDQTLFTAHLTDSLKIKNNRSDMTEHMLNLTLEIIHLLTGEDYLPAKKSCECVTASRSPHVSGQMSPILEPPTPSLIHERNNDLKILKLTNKIIHLLTGEEWKVPESCQDGCGDVMLEGSLACSVGQDMKAELNTSERLPFSAKELASADVHIIPLGCTLENKCSGMPDRKTFTSSKGTQTKNASTQTTDLLPLCGGGGIADTKYTQTECESTSAAVCDVVICDTLKMGTSGTKMNGCGAMDDTKSLNLPGQRTRATGRIYICSVCSRSFPSTSDLNKHRTEHSVEDMSCADCGKHFSSKSHLVRHQKIHTGEKLFLCSECGKCFTLKSALLRHQMIHTGEKPYECSVCGKCFNQRSHFVRHQLSHTGKKPFSCTECGKCFIQKSDLVKHERAHKGKNLSCSVCGKQFCSKMFLIKHQRSHSEINRSMCPQCGKWFSQKSALVVHQRIHTGEKPFSCSDCGKPFNRKSLLVRHQRIHTGEKPFSCSDCGKTFTRTTNLIIHQRIHTGEKPFSCPKCEKSFNSSATLIKHQRVHSM